jgi:16S rRNA (uracil1498-N3)-methyltransferase
VESCKQCGRNRLPTFQTVKDLDEFPESRPARLVIATQAVDPKPVGQTLAGAKDIVLLIGPEGDFTARELAALLESGAHPLSLGPITLRAEVAAITALAIVQHYLGRLGPK